MTITTRPSDPVERESESSPRAEVTEAVAVPAPLADVAAESPFLSEYLVGDEVVSASNGAFADLLAELYDAEFDETLMELVDEADARAQLMGAHEAGADPARSERMLQEWIEPLRMEAEALLQSMGEALDETDPQLMPEGELDELLDRFEPHETAPEPVFDDFLKKIWKKAKKAVKGAVKLAKKGIAAVGKILPINIILKRLKPLIRPLLQRVLKLALNRLPVVLRPAAKQLAKRLFGLKEVAEAWPDEESEAESGEPMGTPASTDVRTLQLAFDTEAATLVLAPSEPIQEAMVTEAAVEAEHEDDRSIDELDRARENFVQRLSELGEGEDPTPVVEQFLPAILPILRMGIKIIGRPKVVRFLASLLGRLIGRYVGPKLTPPLSRAIVDAGLRLMTLETGEDAENPEDPRIAAEAFAATIEDTARAVAELEEDELEDEALLEEVTLEAFERAVASHFPSSVLKSATGSRGTWVAMPRRGAKRYRKFSRVIGTTLRPGVAAAVKTHAGRSLATFVQDRLGQVGPVKARLHLYEAIPGTRLGTIARLERSVPGLGAESASDGRTELLPLTEEAAAALTGEPFLGAGDAEAYEDGTDAPAIGQRFYFLEVAGGRPAGSPIGRGATRARRPRLTGTTAVLDARGGRVVIALFLSEAKAQALAARLRRREPIAAVLASLRPVLAPGLRSLLGRGGRRRLRILGQGEVAMTEQFLPGIKQPSALVARMLARWTRASLARELERQRDAFVTAATAPDDGVTLLIAFKHPAAVSALVPVLRGRFGPKVLTSLAAMARSKPSGATLEIVPGYRRAE